MQIHQEISLSNPPVHNWLRNINVSFDPAYTTPLVDEFIENLIKHFQILGHQTNWQPDNNTDVIITSVKFGDSLNWRDALLFTVRKKYNLNRNPGIYTIIHATPDELQETLTYFDTVLKKDPPDPKDYDFPGLTELAYRTLFEQGRRGGSIMALARLLQSQTKSIRIILVIGESRPQYAYIFDLVGAHPRIDATDQQTFFSDIALRLVTTMSTKEITAHQVLEPPIPSKTWKELMTPREMQKAAIELGHRNFFTEMVRISNLVHVPMVANTVSSQYSEGCFASWDPKINALIATITGSARPVEKDQISEDDLAVITGIRSDGSGALVRHVEGKRNDPPSSEAVEMMDMDTYLPKITLGTGWDIENEVPVVRSKLHGHRGIASYDPNFVEYVPLDPPFYSYPVSCATEAQARGIVAAFSRSHALINPEDPRNVVFTVLPGHGIVIAEKWVTGKEPFQIIYEYMDTGKLQVENHIPQGWMDYRDGKNGFMILESPDHNRT